MRDRVFVDTNILIYAHDVDAGGKHEAAKKVVQDLWTRRSGVLSMQVLQEFYVNVTRKIKHPMSRASARLVVNSYAIWCIQSEPADISMAFRIEDEARVGFWGALILASALKSGASRVLSENLNAGQAIAGIRIVNPFVAVR